MYVCMRVYVYVYMCVCVCVCVCVYMCVCVEIQICNAGQSGMHEINMQICVDHVN